jgi:hypothetical protein
MNESKAPLALTDEHVAAIKQAIRAEGYSVLIDPETGAAKLKAEWNSPIAQVRRLYDYGLTEGLDVPLERLGEAIAGRCFPNPPAPHGKKESNG